MTTWYAVRAFGLVAYALLTASMVWGLWMSTRAPAPPRQGRPWVLDVHRSLGAVALLFTVAHLGALLADSFVRFDPVEVLVPFASYSGKSWAVAEAAFEPLLARMANDIAHAPALIAAAFVFIVWSIIRWRIETTATEQRKEGLT